MTKKELLKKVKEIVDRGSGDPETDHIDLDGLLLEYIGIPELAEMIEGLTLWYA